MKKALEFTANTLVAGLLIVVPAYLAGLLLFKAMKSLGAVVRPLSNLMPHWLPAEHVLSLLLVLCVCFAIGLSIRVRSGRLVVERLEHSVSSKIPGYELFRSLTRRLAGDTQNSTWKPALAEIEEALVPAFIIEELEDGRFTVFVPSVPTPLAGSVYILTPERVHPLDVPLTEAVRTISRWGAGSKDLVAASARKKVA
jgi:uncharacterized membrane protein